MPPIDLSDVEPNEHYWARRKCDPEADLQIVHISTAFGYGPDSLSTAVFSSDQHYSLEDFIYLERSIGQPWTN